MRKHYSGIPKPNQAVENLACRKTSLNLTRSAVGIFMACPSGPGRSVGNGCRRFVWSATRLGGAWGFVPTPGTARSSRDYQGDPKNRQAVDRETRFPSTGLTRNKSQPLLAA